MYANLAKKTQIILTVLVADVLRMLKLEILFFYVKIALIWLFGKSMQIICLLFNSVCVTLGCTQGHCDSRHTAL